MKIEPKHQLQPDAAIYKGTVTHTRTMPAKRSFTYQVYMMYVNVEEIESLCQKSWLWSHTRRFWPASFRRDDFHQNNELPLRQALQKTLHEKAGIIHDGPIYMLSNWRLFGFNFNPLTTYYCFEKDAANPSYIIAEVTNTPWKERHSYVIACDSESHHHGSIFDKKMHVSPFFPMNMQYNWKGTTPGESLKINLKNSTSGKTCLIANLDLNRIPATEKNLNSIVIQFPFMTVKVILGIYWQALKLWANRTQVFSHPKTQNKSNFSDSIDRPGDANEDRSTT